MIALKDRHTLFIQILISLLFLLSLNLHSQNYFITDSYIINDICSCDIDQDGDNDLVISSTSNGLPDSLYIFYNDGTGNLFNTSISRRNGIFVKCGNIDDDNFPDIITKDGSSILCIRNNGDGEFSDEISIAPSQSYRIITDLDDMDGDGWNDLVYTYSGMYTKWGILKNEGDLTFSDHIVFDDGQGGNLIYSLGMLNSDTLPDVSIVFTTEGIYVLMNNGDMTFDSLLLCSYRTWSDICNLNQTPPEDILVFSANTDELIFYENLGSNEFYERNILPLIDAMTSIKTGDLNNDGYDDLSYAKCWWTGCTDSLYISLNDKHWSFLPPQQYYVGSMDLFRTTFADLNGDNYLDIIMFGYSSQNVFRILWNDGNGGFSFDNPVGTREYQNQSKKLFIDISPNPISTSSRITIKSAINSYLEISIADLYGRPVKHFKSVMVNMNESLEINWDGKDNTGNELKIGIYFLFLTDDKNNTTAKKILKY